MILINPGQFSELIRALDRINSSICHLDQTLFDTLGSGKTGDALDAIAELPGTIDNLNEELTETIISLKEE